VSETYGFTVPYDNFLPEVLPFVPDVPEFVAINSVRNACIEFCKKTRFLQADADPQTGVNNVASYLVETPPNTEFVDVIQAWYNNVLLIPKSPDELSRIYRSLDWRTLQGNPAYITRLIVPEVILVPYPVLTLPNALTMRIAVAPTRASTTVDSSLFEHYLEEIAHGAKARLYGTPGQPYSDPAAALQMQARFRLDIADARRKVEKGLGRASTRIEFQGWV